MKFLLKKTCRGFSYCILLIINITFFSICRAGDDTTGVIVGHYQKINSEILGEERNIIISLPSGYDKSDSRYPVLYVLDAAITSRFALCRATASIRAGNGDGPEMIIVGIDTNPHYARDLFPTHVPEWGEDTGGADNFIDFLTDEIMPYIEKNYRTENFNILFGQSNSGLFALYTFLARPESFRAYIVSSPMIGWCTDFILNKAAALLGNAQSLNNYLYIVYGSDDYERVKNTVPSFLDTLTACNIDGFNWDVNKVENGGHVPYTSLYDGLDFIFSGWKLPPGEMESRGIEYAENYYNDLSQKYGFKIRIPSSILIDYGADLLVHKEDYAGAIKVFRVYTREYPDHFRAHYFLGAAYERNLDTALAIEEYKKSLELNPEFGRAAEKLENLQSDR